MNQHSKRAAMTAVSEGEAMALDPPGMEVAVADFFATL